MLVDPITMAASAGQSLFSDAKNLLIGAYNDRKSRNFSRAMMDYQNQIYRQNLEDDRVYNAPAAVMQRYKDAGLNPNLIYQQGTQNATGGSMPSSSSSYSPVELQGLSVMQDILQTKSLEKDLEMKDVQIQGMRTDNATKEQIQPYIVTSAEMDAAAKRIGVDSQKLAYDLALYTHENEKKLSDMAVEEKRNMIDQTLKEFDKKMQAYEDAHLSSEVQRRKIDQEIRESRKRVKLLGKQIEDLQNKINFDRDVSETRKQQLRTDLKNSQEEYFQNLIRSIVMYEQNYGYYGEEYQDPNSVAFRRGWWNFKNYFGDPINFVAPKMKIPKF